MRLLLLKAKSDRKRWQAAIEGYDVTPVWVDPWDNRILAETAEMRGNWLNLDAFQGVMCISPTAAEAVVDALDRYWPMPPVGVHWLCNGPRTAEVLQQAGLTPLYPKTGHTTEDVLALPQTQQVADDKWLIVKGQQGRVVFHTTLTERGAKVTEQTVYERRINANVIQKIPDQGESCQAIWLSSVFLAECLLQYHDEFWRHWPGEWWVSSERLADWCQHQGLSPVVQASGATAEALHELLDHHKGEL